MTSIFSGQLYRNFVSDQNVSRLQNYDVNRFQRTIQQQTSQALSEKQLREGLEFHQALMADLQTKLTELTEKLNNLYQRFLENQVAFAKVSATSEYGDTSKLLNELRSVTDPTSPTSSGYPAGLSGVVPFSDPDRVKNYTYNPYFGSRALDQSDNVLLRSFYQATGSTLENGYTENGAFWSTISYLWGWDLDRINATYATTSNNGALAASTTLTLDNTAGLIVGSTVTVGGMTGVVSNVNGNVVTLSRSLAADVNPGATVTWSGGSALLTAFSRETTNNLQVNVTAVQPNRTPSPPVTVGDRFPLKSSSSGAASYPAVSIDGIRPGGADYNHAQVTDPVNTVGQDSVSMGWEFDDLPLALEVTSVKVLPDGTTQPNGYKVVYDIRGNIPPTDPQYARLIALDGTEPQIIDAPTEIQKVRINQSDLTYAGFTELGSMPLFAGNYATPFDAFGGTGNRTNTTVSDHPKDFQTEQLTSHDFISCDPIVVNAAMKLSFDYRFVMQQNAQSGFYSSPGDDGFVPPYNSHNWSNLGDGILNPSVFSSIINQQVQVGDINGDGVNEFYMILGQVNTSPADQVGFDDPFHSGSGFNPGGVSEQIVSSNTGNGGTGSGPVQVISSSGLNIGDTVRFGSNPGDPVRTITNIQGNLVYLDSALPSIPTGGVVQSPPGTTVTSVSASNSGGGTAGPMKVNDASTFVVGDSVTVYDGSNVNRGTYTVAAIDTANNTITLSPPVMSGSTPVVLTSGRVEKASTATGTGGGSTESVILTFEQINTNTMRVGVVVDGDIHHFEIEIQNLKIESYSGNLGTWQQGLYNGSAPALGNGALPITGDPNDVINKYSTDQYNFTQFYNTYNNPATVAGGTAANLNDILRSPYEYGLLNIGTGSELSGEMWIDINDRRLNLSAEDYDNATTQPDWSSTATVMAGDYVSGANVSVAYDFNPAVNPEDLCIPDSSAHPAADREGTANDSDPYTVAQRLDDQSPTNTNSTPADPMRSSDIAASPTIPAGYYAGMAGGSSNDITGTVDRVAGTSGMSYTIQVPTTDLNILKKENDVVINLGSLADRDYGIHIEDPYLEYRVIPDYKTVPRYRVDASGNIYDRFGYGHYDPTNPADMPAIADLYTTKQINTPVSTNPLLNGQVSNYDGVYDNNAYINSAGTNGTNARMSANGDDYNLFDYVPDLRDDPNSLDPDVLRGERYVGSLPTNFYYYREALDQGAGGNTVPTNGPTGQYNNDGRPSLNFDGRMVNTDGQYNDPTTNPNRTTVYNTSMPSFANVKLGYVEQDAKYNNTQAHTTSAVWRGFPGIGGATVAAQLILHPNPSDGTVLDTTNVLGYVDGRAARIRTGNDLQLEMFTDSSQMGYLQVYETYASPTDPPLIQQAGVISPTGRTGAAGSPVHLDDVSAFKVGDEIYYDDGSGISRRKVITSVVMTGPGNAGDIEFAANSPYAGDNTPVEGPLTGGVFSKYTPVLKTAAHAVPLPLANGTTFTFESYAARTTVTRTGSETRNDASGVPTTFLHVDSGLAFRNPPPPTMQIVIGTGPSAETRTISPSDVDINASPNVIRLQPPLSNPLPGADVPVKMIAGQFTVSIDDGAVPHSKITLTYDDRGTTLPGLIDSVQLSPEMDRVGRTIGDDARTTPGETDAIAPEYFQDMPQGYIQPDGRIDLALVGRDVNGNQQPRRLKEIRVTVESGEQVILGADGKIRQEYSTNALDSIIGTTEGGLLSNSGTWPIALFDEGFNPLNPTPTTNLDILVGYYQGITAATATDITVTDSTGFKVGETVTINGQQRKVTSVSGNTVTLDRPLDALPRYGDVMSLGDGTGTRAIQAYLNRSFAMSTNAPIKIDLLWEDYEVSGYPPIATAKGNSVPETVGFSTASPSDLAPESSYLGPNYLVVGSGRSGGSSSNDFTTQLKTILDNPEYAELLRHNLFQNVYISASINDSFNDVVSGKLMLDYDRQHRRMELSQTAFSAYYKSI